jgi:hypothetical protein
MKQIVIVATAAGKAPLTRNAQTLTAARYWNECLEALGYSVRIAEGAA